MVKDEKRFILHFLNSFVIFLDIIPKDVINKLPKEAPKGRVIEFPLDE